MNSSSVPDSATMPLSATRSSWVFRIVRGDWGTGAWSSQTRSHCTMAVAGRWVSRRSVAQSGTNSMSPYPFSQEEMV